MVLIDPVMLDTSDEMVSYKCYRPTQMGKMVRTLCNREVCAVTAVKGVCSGSIESIVKCGTWDQAISVMIFVGFKLRF